VEASIEEALAVGTGVAVLVAEVAAASVAVVVSAGVVAGLAVAAHQGDGE
jgi:hypothetical protein